MGCVTLESRSCLVCKQVSADNSLQSRLSVCVCVCACVCVCVCVWLCLCEYKMGAHACMFDSAHVFLYTCVELCVCVCVCVCVLGCVLGVYVCMSAIFLKVDLTILKSVLHILRGNGSF